MRGPLALPVVISNNRGLNEFVRGLQSMFFIETDADGVERVVEDQDVNGGDLVDYVYEFLDKSGLRPIEDPRSFWVNTDACHP